MGCPVLYSMLSSVGGIMTLTCYYFKLAIEDLKKHPDLQVKMTDSIEVTVILLSSLTSELIEW